MSHRESVQRFSSGKGAPADVKKSDAGRAAVAQQRGVPYDKHAGTPTGTEAHRADFCAQEQTAVDVSFENAREQDGDHSFHELLLQR